MQTDGKQKRQHHLMPLTLLHLALTRHLKVIFNKGCLAAV
jgi:hypothetical protein